jgi:RNA polymerase sigma factor (sigma-70 family)
MARHFPPTLARILGEMTAGLRRDATAGPTLLTHFAETRDEEAFRGLVRLYGPLVWGVCQRCLRDPNDAEDALQATFIVLARKAGRIRCPERLSGWLHGVALRAARNVRKLAVRRREEPLSTLPNEGAETAFQSRELRETFDVELSRLPEKLRLAFVLCRVEGRTYAQTADLLGCPLRTVANRVEKATELLRARLEQRGLAPLGTLAGLLPNTGVSVTVLDRVVCGALRESSSTAAAVAEVVLRGMTSHSFWWLVGAAAVVLTGIGVGVVAGSGMNTPHDSGKKPTPATVLIPKAEQEPPSLPPGVPLSLRIVAVEDTEKGRGPTLAIRVINRSKEVYTIRYTTKGRRDFQLDGARVTLPTPRMSRPMMRPGAEIPPLPASRIEADQLTLAPQEAGTLAILSPLNRSERLRRPFAGSDLIGPPAPGVPVRANYGDGRFEQKLISASYKLWISPPPPGAAVSEDGFGEIVLQSPKFHFPASSPQ